MLIVRKVIKVGNSRAVTVPAQWIDFYEEQTGEELKKVAVIEVDGSLKISPIPKKAKTREAPKIPC